ncbi:zinc finger CCCH domain-containing protein 46 [Phtheirospermum japonicum]|uniref:Zinc finger CCCH domain-containing protein 46 n=1 Tax=Phtheirospermum japonicum TaxID=374723 RepID=A0A830CT58_9LAMI|nr:zinc finger CCCH domain-containing protein 46 [Phtheirospermum japonicum]
MDVSAKLARLLRACGKFLNDWAVATNAGAGNQFTWLLIRRFDDGDGIHKFGRRSDFGLNCVNPVSRQIYLTFPAEKTVKLILAKGNPHFVCDARVLVKPYKEKGKIPDKHRKQQQMERGDFTGCGSPTGARMFYNTRDMLWNRKLEEQADLQQSIELQNRRLMGLQFLDVKRNSHHHRTLSTGVVVSPPATFFPTSFDGQNVVVVVVPSNPSSPVAKEGRPMQLFVDGFYHAFSYIKSYSAPLHPVSMFDQPEAPPDNALIIPPETMRPPGRPKRKRIPSQGEHIPQSMTCGRCGKVGNNNRKSCTEPLA